MASLDDEQVAALNLAHDALEDLVDEGVEGGVADNVVGDVDEEAFVGADGRRECVKDIGEGGQSTASKLVA